MPSKPHRCIFCLKTKGPFTREEHPIPESLGNDDLVLPPGLVCDGCNQYFGSKVEQEVLGKAPFAVARVSQAIRNKKGRHPSVGTDGLSLRSLGFWDRLLFRSDPPHRSIWPLQGGRLALNPQWVHPDLLVRFLLKVGLELLALSDDVDPFSSMFDGARECARRGHRAGGWDFALGIYPKRSDLIISKRTDDFGPLETRQIYQWGLGVMESGDVMFNFIFETMMFAANLSRPPSLEYILGFNKLNPFCIESRWSAFKAERRSSNVL